MPFPPPKPPEPTVWLSQPSADDIARAAGFFAPANTTTTKASMTCYVLADGRLDACTIDRLVDNRRYDDAMLSLKDRYRLDLKASAPRTQVTVGVTFPKLQDAAAKLVAQPSAQEMRAALPDAEDATVALHCRVAISGDVKDCVADAGKDGERFKTAALALAGRFRFAPLTLNGRPTEGYATVTVTSSAHVIVSPDWMRKPTGDDIASYYPEVAARSGVGGFARMKCRVSETGSLTGCYILEESPGGLGFGETLLKVAPKFQMKPKTLDGKPVTGGDVVIPVHFVAPDTNKIAPGTPGSFKILPWAPWIEAPTAEDVAAAFPSKARDAKAFGSTAIRCEFKRDGRLTACEPSAGDDRFGFSAAGLKLASKFRANLQGVKPYELGALRIAISFSFSERTLQAAGERYVRGVDWLRSPDAAAVVRAYPEKAAKAGVLSGKAVVDCVVAGDGMLTACAPKSEEPAGLDFGPSGVRVASIMQANLWTRDGEAAPGQHVLLPLHFIDSGEPPEPKAPAPAPPPGG